MREKKSMKNLYNLTFCISLFTFAIIDASQQEGILFFYDERTNTEWICGEQRFSRLVIDAPTKNHVFYGEFSSDSNIHIIAKNLIIIGSLLSANNIGLKASHDFFNAGRIEADKSVNIIAGENVYNGLNDEAIARIQALGIDVSFADAEHRSLKVSRPSRN